MKTMSEMYATILGMQDQKYDRQKKHITKNGKYFISTNDTWDRGWETMVFEYDSKNECVRDWTELDVNHYNDVHEAYAGHEVMVQKWEVK